jgi:hypothetical protein
MEMAGVVETHIMALHVQDAFSDIHATDQVMRIIRREKPAAAIFTEAWAEDRAELVDAVTAGFRYLGYHVHHTLNGDDGEDPPRQDRHGMMGIVRNSRLTDNKPGTVRLGTRNALMLPLVDRRADTEIKLYGIHLDDDNEARRLAQAKELIKLTENDDQLLVGGKFNAMYRSDISTKVIRHLGVAARMLPAMHPRTGDDPTRLQRFASLSIRSGDMADGRTMRAFQAAGFIDADPQHLPTKGPFSLDRFVYRGLARQVYLSRSKPQFKDQRIIRVTL